MIDILLIDCSKVAENYKPLFYWTIVLLDHCFTEPMFYRTIILLIKDVE